MMSHSRHVLYAAGYCPCSICTPRWYRNKERQIIRRREDRAWRLEQESEERDHNRAGGHERAIEFHDHPATAYELGEYGLPYWMWHNSTDRPRGAD